jgi:hypothetical protein
MTGNQPCPWKAEGRKHGHSGVVDVCSRCPVLEGLFESQAEGADRNDYNRAIALKQFFYRVERPSL